MKKLLPILTIIAALSGSASAYVPAYYAPGSLTPADWQPTYNVEALYAFGEHDVPDAWGIRGSFCLYDSGEGAVRHQFSINVASEWGSDNDRFEGKKIDQDLWMLPVTAGYDLNVGLTDTVFLDLGAKAGWATGNYKESGEFGSDKTHFNGFTMGVGAGLKFICGERIYVKLGYELNRTFISDNVGVNINQHVITAGIGTQF